MSDYITKKLNFKDDALREFFFEGNDEYNIHEEGSWEDKGKYQYATNVFKDKHGDFWALNAFRAGSYFSDFEYDIKDCIVKVEQVEVVKKEWRRFKKQ